MVLALTNIVTYLPPTGVPKLSLDTALYNNSNTLNTTKVACGDSVGLCPLDIQHRETLS